MRIENKTYRLAYLTTHPIQYQAPLLRIIAAHPQVDLTVFFMSDMSITGYIDPEFGVSLRWDVPLLDGYRNVTLPVLGTKERISFWRPFVYGLWRHLRAGKFDSVWLPGYMHQAYLRALLFAKILGMKVLLRGEADLLSPRHIWKYPLKKLFLSRLFRCVDAFLCSYIANAEYYLAYGVPEEKLFFCPCAVDNAFWQEQAEKLKGAKPRVKKAIGIPPESPVILFAAKLIPRKRPFDLLQAFEGIYGHCDAWLVFVGESSLKPDLQQYANEHGLHRISFVGFKNQSEIAPFYAMADIFVLPSDHDPSPKVLNEAMNFSLPVVVTDRVGTAADLVKSGGNGFIYPVGNVKALEDYLLKLLENPEMRERMGKRSLEMVSEWSFENDVIGILAALEYVTNNRVRIVTHA